MKLDKIYNFCCQWLSWNIPTAHKSGGDGKSQDLCPCPKTRGKTLLPWPRSGQNYSQYSVNGHRMNHQVLVIRHHKDRALFDYEPLFLENTVLHILQHRFGENEEDSIIDLNKHSGRSHRQGCGHLSGNSGNDRSGHIRGRSKIQGMLLWLHQDCTEVCRTDLVAKVSAIRGRVASIKPL